MVLVFLSPIFYRILDVMGTKKHIAISKVIALDLVSSGSVNQNNIVVVHNGINLKEFDATSNLSSDLQSRMGFNLKGRITIGMVANFGPYKDHESRSSGNT